MSATLTGRVVGDGGTGIAGLRVVIRDETACVPSDLVTTTTDGSGNYSAIVPDDPLAQDDLGSTRKVGVRIYPAKGSLRFPRFSGHPSAWSESRSVMKEERYATAVSAALSARVSA